MKNLIVNAGKDSTQIFEEILDTNNYTSELITIDITEDQLIINIHDEDNFSLYTDYIASRVTNHILNFIEPQIIREEVELGCLDLLDDEIEENISQRVEWEILHKNQQKRDNYFYYLQEDICDGLLNNGTFNLDGFINFRYNTRRLEIKDYVNIALEEYFTNENAEQFVSVIKKIISTFQPKIDLMHIITIDTDEHELITDQNERVDMENVKRVVDELIYDHDEIEVDQLQLILSVLTTVLPHDIMMHTEEKYDPYTSQMLKKIYGDRIKICKSCEYCESIKSIDKTEE